MLWTYSKVILEHFLNFGCSLNCNACFACLHMLPPKNQSVLIQFHALGLQIRPLHMALDFHYVCEIYSLKPAVMSENIP